MYTLTLIRLSDNYVFENTDVFGLYSSGQIELELAEKNADFDQVEKFLNLKKGEKTTISINKNDKIWFFYITKIN